MYDDPIKDKILNKMYVELNFMRLNDTLCILLKTFSYNFFVEFKGAKLWIQNNSDILKFAKKKIEIVMTVLSSAQNVLILLQKESKLH